MVQDIRYSIRVLASNRVVAGLSVLCLSIGLGTNTTVFTFVNALLLQPLPLESPGALVAIHETRHDDPGGTGPASYPNFLDWTTRASGAVWMAAQRSINVRVSDGGEPVRYSGALVSSNFFSVLGIQPAMGRGFLESEDRPGAAPVVVVSHTLWQQRYNEDPTIVGRSIIVDGTSRTVIGVMPRDLSQIALQRVLRGARLWMPLGSAQPDNRRDRRTLIVYGRLGRGITREVAGARLTAVAGTLEAMHPLENDGWSVSVQPLRLGFSARTRAMLLMMMGAVTFVLLIACANVSSLTLARATARRREIATRLALGAPRRRIVRQWLVESLIVALASIPFGIAFAYWGRQLLLTTATPEQVFAFSLDRQVLLFTIALALLTSLLSGLLPAMHAVRRVHHDVLSSRRDATAGPPHSRLSQALVIAEVALSLVLLVGASLFVRSFRNLLDADGGFDTSRILTVRIEVARESAELLSERASQHVHALLDRLEALPGVTTVAAANLMPLRDGGVRTLVVPDAVRASLDAAPAVLIGGITSNFFGVLNVPILQGRAFSDVEGRSRSAVAIINKTMAQRFWPDGTAIGRRFRAAAATEHDWLTVVGVSDDILTWDLSNRPLPTAYIPYSHAPEREPSLFIRTSGNPALLASSARAAIHAFDSTLPILDLRTMTDVHYLALSRHQTLAWLFAVLGGIALFLGATGVYGVLSYFVSQRTHEIGVRAALGADRRTLVRLFVRQGLTMTLAGIGLGVVGALGLARVVRGQLHDVAATDPGSLAGVAVLLIGIGFLATYIPARRAAAVDPLIAIRD
jgi:putative ABC transport system permease protein